MKLLLFENSHKIGLLLLHCPLTNLSVYFSFFQDSSHFHPFIHTKMNLSTKSPLHPQSISHPDSLSPGPFSHLGSILGDIHDHSYSPYHCNALYNKVRDLASQQFGSANEVRILGTVHQ